MNEPHDREAWVVSFSQNGSWNFGKPDEWQPLKPTLVIEVTFDHATGGRFRHGTKLLRWRPDKAPTQCTMEQLAQKGGNLLSLLK